MQAAKATRTNCRTDKKSGKFFNLKRWRSFGKALCIEVLVAKFALKLLKKNTDEHTQLRKLGLNLLVRNFQEQHFDEEMKAIRNGQDTSRTSNLLQLYLFIDDNRLLKVGGRLAAADCLKEKAKFQMILPPKTHFSRIVIRHNYIVHLYCGLNATFANTRQQFWIIQFKTMARAMMSNCITCVSCHKKSIESADERLP